jgi:hypothetical protein
MRRPFVISTGALALALLPAALYAQTPPAQQPPAQQPPAQQPPAQQPPAQTPPAVSKEPRTTVKGDAAVFLFQVKPDQTATFEELAVKVRDGLAKSDKPERKQQLASWKVYRAEPGMGANALYLLVVDPAVKGAEYDLLMLFSESLGAEAGTPANQEAMKKYVGAFASGVSLLTLTPVAGAK